MTRVLCFVGLFLFISLGVSGQCANAPTVKLSGLTGSTCNVTPVTLSGNTFGGSATKVTITENGAGAVSPVSASKSPFSFTYTPASGDLGKSVVITVTTDNPLGLPCAAAKATFTITVKANPAAPVVGTVTRPTCSVSTGSVILSGLPSSGIWMLTRTPGGVTTTGTGISTTISGIPSGTYTYVVSNSAGCSSNASGNVVIPAQPASPASPVQTVDCTLGIGKAVVTVTSPTGTGLTYSLDAGTYQSGTSFSGVLNGSHTVTVKNASGCTTTGAVFQVSCGCLNPPTVTLSSTLGSTCGIAPVTISGNSFGGIATGVLITENGAGVVSPASSTTKPFSFTYTPAAADAGKLITITVTTSIPQGTQCVAASATYLLSVVANPAAPLAGIVTQPTCTVSTGSVELHGLPAEGAWILLGSPDGVTISGSGTSTLVQYLATGIHTFTVTNSSGCVSASSAGISINAQPAIPAAPVVGTITTPTCFLATGSVRLTGLPVEGNWTLVRYPGTVSSSGTGGSTTISGIPAGVYNYSVTNAGGCISQLSSNVFIPVQPTTPLPPSIGTIIQPHAAVPTGSVILNGLPENGAWTLTRSPDNVTANGTGTTTTVSGLMPGTYKFKVTNSMGCISELSENLTINQASTVPEVIITNPAPVCFPSTVDLTDPKITAGTQPNPTFTYWSDAGCTTPLTAPTTATAGTWFIKGTFADGLFSIKPVTVTVYHIPAVNAGPDQVLANLFQTNLNADLVNNYETGIWSVISGSGVFFDSTYAKTAVTGLSSETNLFLWTVSNGACPPAIDSVQITVKDYIVPTLITPDMDGKNDYFVIKGINEGSRIELVIFDRRGVQLFKNMNYDNLWNGIDLYGKPLPGGTYFYVISEEGRKSIKGYIVIRK
jgi:gliding motility-associated-like protein